MSTAAAYARNAVTSVRTGSITKQHSLPSPTLSDRYTIAKFANLYRQKFPVKFTVAKGFYGPNEDLRFSEGDKYLAHSTKQSTVVNIKYDNGTRENILVNSSVPFAILFDPYGNTKEAMTGYRFEKVSELMKLPVLPLVLWSRKAYRGSTSESSVSANELLIVRRVKSKLVGRQQLKVYSHTEKKEKTLYTTCVGSFSTKPRDICLFLSDILKNMPDIFPCRAVMLNPVTGTSQAPLKGAPRSGPCIVTLMHSSIDTSLVISSALKQDSRTEIPIDLDILVRVDNTEEEYQGEAVYEDTSLYTPITTPQQMPGQPAQNQTRQIQDQQFYTNVHFGQERSRELFNSPAVDASFASVESAIEQGHYQAPREIGRTPSDPIAIESVYHPPEGHAPPNYVLFSKNHDESGRGKSPASPAAASASPSSPSYRPPLPPPNKTKKDHHQRSMDYTYVDTDPTRSTRVAEPRGPRSLALESGDNGSILATSNPDSAYSDKSFGSSGSGGAAFDRRSSLGSRSSLRTPMHPPGSGDGVVERQLRSSSISSAGYSYAKTEGNPHPSHAHQPHPHGSQAGSSVPNATPNPGPTSPHHYSHLRSRSGPPILPQYHVPLSTQLQAQNRPVASTRYDPETNSLVAVQRQQSTPSSLAHLHSGVAPNSRIFPPHHEGIGNFDPPLQAQTRWQDLSVVKEDMESSNNDRHREREGGHREREGGHRPDSLEYVMDDLARITQELDETIFLQDENSPAISPEGMAPPTQAVAPPTPKEGSGPPETVAAALPSKQAQESSTTPTTLPPEVIEQHKAYLKAMDNYQVLRLLENMGLEQYTPTFKQEQINGDILSTCDDALLKDELKVTSRLHRMRLLRVIEGAYSVHEMMSGKDGYIFMSSAGKQS